LDKEIESLEKRKAKTQQIKQGMMQELLTGRTRLNHDWKGLADGHDATANLKSSHQAHPKNQGTDN
jgi:restriction endonuclease S subunit